MAAGLPFVSLLVPRMMRPTPSSVRNQEDRPYEAGDHLGLCPSNRAVDVAFLKERLLDVPSLEQPLVLLETTHGKVWKEVEDFPRHLLFDDILNYVVDLSRLPSQDVLKMMLKHAKSKADQEQLKLLVSDNSEYEMWSGKINTFCDTLRQFPSVQLPSAEVGHCLCWELCCLTKGDGDCANSSKSTLQHCINCK